MCSDQLLRDAALTAEQLPSLARQKVSLWGLAIARRPGVAEMTEEPCPLKAAELVTGGGVFQAADTGELLDREEAVALDEEEP